MKNVLKGLLIGAWAGAVDPKDLPVEMLIDWVRFYEWKK